MGWGKFDDHYPSNRKIRPLSDAGFRLDVSSILWSSANLTDGFIPRDELHLASDVKQPGKAATELVRRGRWHAAGEGCRTETCPAGKPGDGWQIHDYLGFNDSKKVVEDRRTLDRNRKRKKPDPGGTTPPEPPGIPEDSDRNLVGIPEDSTPEGDRNPSGIQPSARPRARTRAPAPRPVPSPSTSGGDDPTDLATVDAGEARDDIEPGHDHGPTGAITALYAAGVPLTDHGKAHRAIAAGIQRYGPDNVRRGVLRLIAEDRACTPDTLRIAIHADDPPASTPGQPRRRTASEKASGWLTVGLDEPDDPGPQLRAISGGAP